ncbi:ABC transporter permease subunit, partial [Rhizobiaceae sp. 2RAB30]
MAMFTWMAVPPIILGFGWILLLNPGSGVLNGIWAQIAGQPGPLTIYSMWALIFITGVSVTPTAFVMIGGLFRNMDSQLESAGYVHGGTRMSVTRRIIIPLLLPGLLSVAIYVFIAVVQTFELPLIVGLTARIPVLSTRIYLLSSPDV